MADSLDDFFAKKDRSKKSKGKKIILPVAPTDPGDDSDRYPDDESTNIVPVKEPVININIKLGDEVCYPSCFISLLILKNGETNDNCSILCYPLFTNLFLLTH